MDPSMVLACVTAAGAAAYVGHSLQQAGRFVKDSLERAGLQTVQHMQEHGPHFSSPAKKEKSAKDAPAPSDQLINRLLQRRPTASLHSCTATPMHTTELGLRARALLPGSHAADTECQALAAQLAEEAPLSRRPATHSQYGGPWRSFLACRVDVAGKAIAFHYSLAGLPNPAAAESCANVRATAARRLQVQRLHREAMSAADLAAVLCAHAGPGAPLLRLMMATTVALMFYGFLRFDDMAEVSVHADLLLITPRHMAIFIPRSKTDVAMDGQWVHIARLPHLGGFCPVALTERLLRQGAYRRLPAAADEDVGPLLRTVQYTAAGGRLQRLVGTRASPVFSMSYGAFRSNFLARLREAGVSGNIKPHSMRIGGNSAAADAGVPASLRQPGAL
eukprot:XP_001703084.1 predicted protein [Chlamydomonas reinhardtii]